MISTEGQKSAPLIRSIQEHEAEPRSISGLFSLSEIDQIKAIKDECYLDEDNCAAKLILGRPEPLGKMAHPKIELKIKLEDLVRPKLDIYLKYPYEISFSFHRNFFPYGTHTDSGYDPDEFIYKQGIIPLDVYPNNGEVYTVVFKQKCYHSASYPSALETIETLRVEEKNQVLGYSQEAPDILELKRYWCGVGLEQRFSGFDILLPFRWNKGDMAMWDRSHFHCSSDFKAHNIEGKVGLMWITRRLK